MRYTQSHKQETHQRVVKIAARELRKNGPDQLAIAEVMKAAGLTHGGFYAHFKSKDALLAEALEQIFVRASQKTREMVAGLPPRHALATYIDHYVSATHRDHPERGCPIVALNSDLPRQSKKFRAAFDAGVKSLVDALAGWLADAGFVDAETLASSILSAMVGAVALSRAVSDTQLSDELLDGARASIKARFGLSDAALSRKTVS
ncbi:MAG: TetR/AcrR family transcriptional regulator [Rhizomicrobium sp.]|jgi:TetR/AcrR family transcriptional repressor of nem operon